MVPMVVCWCHVLQLKDLSLSSSLLSSLCTIVVETFGNGGWQKCHNPMYSPQNHPRQVTFISQERTWFRSDKNVKKSFFWNILCWLLENSHRLTTTDMFRTWQVGKIGRVWFWHSISGFAWYWQCKKVGFECLSCMSVEVRD